MNSLVAQTEADPHYRETLAARDGGASTLASDGIGLRCAA